MILDRLELQNFKRFRHAEIDFHDGITGILGNNGTTARASRAWSRQSSLRCTA